MHDLFVWVKTENSFCRVKMNGVGVYAIKHTTR